MSGSYKLCYKLGGSSVYGQALSTCDPKPNVSLALSLNQTLTLSLLVVIDAAWP